MLHFLFLFIIFFPFPLSLDGVHVAYFRRHFFSFHLFVDRLILVLHPIYLQPSCARSVLSIGKWSDFILVFFVPFVQANSFIFYIINHVFMQWPSFFLTKLVEVRKDNIFFWEKELEQWA